MDLSDSSFFHFSPYFWIGRFRILRNALVPIIISILQAFLCLSCNEQFSPKAPFEPQPVVYSVIYTDRPQQFVRVYSTYDVSGYYPYANATDGAIAGATVSVTGPQGTFLFRDTLLQRPDTSRYKTPIYAYVADWRPKPGQAYTLTVNAGKAGSTQATVTTPPLSSSQYWNPVDPTISLDYPDTSTVLTTVSAIFLSSQSTKAISEQVYILYTVQNGGGREEEREAQFLGPNVAMGGGGYTSVWCDRASVSSVLHNLSKKYAGSKLTFKRIVFRLIQMEENWYEYYSIVRLAQDSRTTRFDQPDFTNLSRGYGVFGACTVDSLVHEYPADFRFNH